MLVYYRWFFFFQVQEKNRTSLTNAESTESDYDEIIRTNDFKWPRFDFDSPSKFLSKISNMNYLASLFDTRKNDSNKTSESTAEEANVKHSNN